MNDDDKMPFGKHKGLRMVDVPDEYLLWFWRENKDDYQSGGYTLTYNAKKVMGYIQDSFNDSDL